MGKGGTGGIVSFHSVDAPVAERLRRCLGEASLDVLSAAARARLRADPVLRQLPHGTLIALTPAGDRLVRTLEIDPRGHVLALMSWSPGGLDAAWVRLPDRSWLRVEPRAALSPFRAGGRGEPGGAPTPPWSDADGLWHCRRPGEPGEPLTVFEAIDYARVTRIPTLWDPARLPAGGASAVLNLLAGLAEDQGQSRIVHDGPYPGEQLFLSLLESFRPAATTADPLAEFMGGALAWLPAPHERQLLDEGVHGQWRGRLEKVVWRGRAYHRAEWWGIQRHAPRRIADAAHGAVAGLWFLGECLEQHLVIAGGSDVRVLPPLPLHDAAVRPFPAAVAGGLAAVIAATGAPALAPLVAGVVTGLGVAWGPVEADLIDASARPLHLSTRLRAALAARLEGASRPQRATIALSALGELAALAADPVRHHAQAHLAALGPEAQERLLTAPPPLPPDTAARITAAVEALLADLSGA